MRSLALLLLATAPLLARGQEPVPTPTPTPTPGPQQPAPAVPEAPVAEPGTELPQQPPDYGRFNIGPFWLTPSLRIGNVIYDSNVLYQPTGERSSDIIASAGPGLLTILPMGLNGRFELDGTVQYVYFHKNVDKRRLNSAVRGSYVYDTEKTQLNLTEAWLQTNSRPDPEVDAYLLRTVESTTADLRRQISGPYFFSLDGGRSRTKVLDDEPVLGNDIQSNLTRDKYDVGGELEYAITVKTSFIAGANHQWDRFPDEESRNGQWDRFYGGVRVSSDTLLSGQVMVGNKRFALDAADRGRSQLWAQGNFLYLFSPRTSITAGYLHDFDYSAYDTNGDTPTIQRDVIDVGINKELSAKFDIRLFANHTKLLSDGAITIVEPDGSVDTAVRDDSYWRYGGNLGYYIRDDLRAGVEVSYSQRQSSVDYFGVTGLNFGVTVTYSPPQPTY